MSSSCSSSNSRDNRVRVLGFEGLGSAAGFRGLGVSRIGVRVARVGEGLGEESSIRVGTGSAF
jgi:hypothetical protein